MRTKTELSTRSELSENQERHADRVETTQEQLVKASEDIETLRRLAERLEPYAGTAEGTAEFSDSMEKAERSADDVYDREDQETDRAVQENEGFREELTDSSDATEIKLGEVSDGSASLEAQETVRELRGAKEALLRDIDVFADLVKKAMEAGERGKQIRQELGQVRHGRSAQA